MSLRILAAVVVSFCLLVGQFVFGQEGKDSFPLSAVTAPTNASAFQTLQVERLNVAIEELKFVYQKFQDGGDLRSMLEASERVNEIRRDALPKHSDQIAFAARHFVVAEGIERAIGERVAGGKATEQELRLAKLHRLTMQGELLRPATATVTIVPNPPGTILPPDRTSRPPVAPSAVPPAEKPPVELKNASADALASLSAKLLDAHSHGSLREFFMSPDGRFAVIVELVDEESARYALWDLDGAKLIRYFASAVGKDVKPFKGKEDDDFGADVTHSLRGVQRFAFSPDGKFIAAMTSLKPLAPGEIPADEVLVWEASSGALKRIIRTETHHHPHTFFFIDSKRVATKAFHKTKGVAVEAIDVTTGEIGHLLPFANFEMYGGAVHGELVAFAAPGKQMLVVNSRTGENIELDRAPANTSNFAADRTWFSADGKFVFARKHEHIHVWDMTTKKFVSELPLGRDRPGAIEMTGIAETAGLIARTKGTKTLEILNLPQFDLVSAIQIPFEGARVAGLSRDGKRLAFPGPDRNILIVDLPNGIPPGNFSLTKFGTDLKASR